MSHPQQPQQPNQGQPPAGYNPGQPPQGYYQQGPPPKKSHAVRNVLLILLAVFVLGIGGCLAIVGTAANEVSKSAGGSGGGSFSSEQQNDTPTPVQEGKAFTHDDFKVARGWTIGREQYTKAPTIKNIGVTNVSSDGQRTALLTFRFYKGKQVLAEVECSTNEMQAGESSKMDCFSTADGIQGYDAIKVADAF